MKQMFKVAAVIVVTSALWLPFAPAAQARGGDCASRSEFRRIDKGMTMRRVTAIIGTDGIAGGVIRNLEYKYTYRQYPKCGTIPRLASVSYRKPIDGGQWRVISKAWD